MTEDARQPIRHGRIAVFDSGVGGVELYFMLRSMLENERFFYFADTKNNPYGEKSPETLTGYLDGILEGFRMRQVKLVVIACNTASAVWLNLAEDHPLKQKMRWAGIDVIPMIHPQVMAELVPLNLERLLVAGTRLTVESGYHMTMAEQVLPKTTVQQVKAPEWVEAVEATFDAEQKLRAVELALAPFKDWNPQAILLACTHFSRLVHEIGSVLGQNCRIINPVYALAHFVKGYLQVRGLAAPKRPRSPDSSPTLYTNGDPEALDRQLRVLEAGKTAQVRKLDVRDDLAGKRIDIVGLGLTGQSVLRYVSKRGAEKIVLRDSHKTATELKTMSTSQSTPLEILSGDHYLEGLEDSDLIIRSPGVRAELPPLVHARERGVPVLGDIDLFLQEAKGSITAITGTNGKTTTTLLLERMFEEERPGKAHLVGNIGKPVLDSLSAIDKDSLCAVELSSFQLEELDRLPAKASILLNLTPDHLDRHGDMDGYARAKGRVFTLLGQDAWAVYNIDDANIVNRVLPLGIQARLMPFSTRRTLPYGGMIQEGSLVLRRQDGREFKIDDYLNRKQFTGRHNLENMLASTLAAWLTGISSVAIENVALGFAGAEYRIEPFAEHNGVVFFDDSKGTNPDATVQALDSLDETGYTPLLLIAGGDNKGVDLNPVVDACRGRIIKAYLFGSLALELEPLLVKAGISTDISENLEQASEKAFHEATSGQSVVFSAVGASPPGEKYFQRGNRFKDCIRGLGAINTPERRRSGLWLEDPLAHKDY